MRNEGRRPSGQREGEQASAAGTPDRGGVALPRCERRSAPAPRTLTPGGKLRNQLLADVDAPEQRDRNQQRRRQDSASVESVTARPITQQTVIASARLSVKCFKTARTVIETAHLHRLHASCLTPPIRR